MTTVSFNIEAEPVPASRPRVTGRGVAYYPKKHTAYANFLSGWLDKVAPLRAAGPVALWFMFVMPRYKTSDYPVHRADNDNLSKLPMDAMTKSSIGDEPRFWLDDNMVVHLVSLKRFAREGEEPHTKIKVKTVEEDVQDYVDRMFEND